MASYGRKPVPQPRGLISRRRILLGFCSLAILAIAVNIVFIVDAAMTSESARQAILNDARLITREATASALGQWPSLQTQGRFMNRLLILLGLSLACFGSFIYVFLRRFIAPLDEMTGSAIEVAGGNFNVSFPSGKHDEIGSLGEALYAVASNYQEVLLVTGTSAGRCRSTLDRMAEILAAEQKDSSPPAAYLKKYMIVLEQEIDMLRHMMNDFEFYQVHFDGRKAVRHAAATREAKE